jgi:hypothetical protein
MPPFEPVAVTVYTVVADVPVGVPLILPAPLRFKPPGKAGLMVAPVIGAPVPVGDKFVMVTPWV